MTQILTTEQIQSILKGIEETLRMLQAKSEYREIEATEEFTRANDFNLLDVIHALGEVQEGIENFQSTQAENNGI
ncbi:hypothetical protein [Nostoc sp. CCY0012]|uniref:hypothetical protein n=1 Tax=Nostoc sp. CCY0012 TaxID=1056123 RepID=UPI0039C6BF70